MTCRLGLGLGVLSRILGTIAAMSAPSALADAHPGEEAFIFEAKSGDQVDAYRGTVAVPENRADPDSRTLTIHYVRFPATGDAEGAPLVYLAGGPGGSGIWTAGEWRFPLFMALREYGDVIALDQRGTGRSDDTPPCAPAASPDDPAIESDAAFAAAYIAALEECLGFWRAEGVDPLGYTTAESVADLEALRRHLAADKLSLWGISYGAHLALAAIKAMDDRLDQVILASAEGLDQTVKRPARTDAYFARLEAALADGGTEVDLVALMRRVHAKLEAEPITLAVPTPDGGTVDTPFTRIGMQRAAAAMIADPNRFATTLVQLYQSLDQGVTEPLAQLYGRFRPPGRAYTMRVMPVMMDRASGVTQARRAMIAEETETSLLGPYLNDAWFVLDAAREVDLGDAFRKKPSAETPVLLLSGTLDGRTYLEGQREAVSDLTNVQHVTMVNAGHNLFMVSPEVTATIQAFLRGENVDGAEITLPPPTLGG